MKRDQFIERIGERDVDLLLLEELTVSADFRSWFIEKVFSADVRCTRFISAEHSVVHSTFGESDLLLKFESESGETVAILIENKIDALAQPDQGTRYRERGKVGIDEGRWSRFETCLMAPKAYLDSNTEAKIYDARITYESVNQWFQQRAPTDARSDYRARFIQDAIEKNRRGYVPVPHEGVTKFWRDYWELVQRDFPIFK